MIAKPLGFTYFTPDIYKPNPASFLPYPKDFAPQRLSYRQRLQVEAIF